MSAPGSPQTKQQWRRELRAARRAHVAELPATMRALILHRPPAPLVTKIGEAATVGLYHASADEAPTRGYAKWLRENGHRIALPWFQHREAPMRFREWSDPWDDSDLVAGPWRALQPRADAPELTPDLALVPLLGFTADGHRLGQGAGHYDRWLADHPQVPAIGLAWDSQKVEALPIEPHDRTLVAVITPTRIYGELD
jgi:5-formyltetrahydrofolate cyclo-ligase